MNRIFLTLIVFVLLLSLFPQVKIFADTDLTNSWSTIQSLPSTRASHGLLELKSKLFIIGGANSDDYSSVLISTPSAGGNISSWEYLSDLPEARYWAPVVNKDEDVYILGGSKFEGGITSYFSSVLHSRLLPVGSFGSWGQTFPLPSNRSLGAAAISGDYIYFSGGFNTTGYTNKVYASHIKPDGMLDPWFEVSALPLTRIGHGMIEDNGSLYVLGGDNANQVYRATVNTSNGTISSWSQISTLPEKLYRSAVIKIGNQIYMIGGHNGTSTINKIYFTTINSDGSLGPWQLSANTLPLSVQGGAVAQAGKYLYLTGGFRSPPGIYLNSVYKTELNISIEPDLNVPLFKQTDPAWGSQTYDTANLWSSGKTGIDRWGCAMTSAAMVFNYHGIKKLPDGQILDPGTLNTWLKTQPDGYVGEGLVNWNALSRLSKIAKSQNSDFSFDALENYRVGGFAKTQLEQDLDNNIPGILEVPNHFVVGKGLNSGSILIHDPFYARIDLSEYSDTFKSLRRFVPSHTDLSTLMLTVPEGVVISVTDENGNVVGEGYLQEPIHDDIGGGNNPKAFYIYEIKKPDLDVYNIKISADTSTQYVVHQYAYDENGNVKVIKTSGIVENGRPDEFIFYYNKEDVNSSSIVQEITHASLLADLDALYNLGEISNIGIYITLRQNISVSQQLLSVSKAASTAHSKNVLSILKSQRKKFVSETAYKILYPQVQQLLSTI